MFGPCLCGDPGCFKCFPNGAKFEQALEQFTQGEYDAWERMGEQACSCGLPLRPCPKGPGADEPGFVGFFPCRCKTEKEEHIDLD